MSTRDRPARNPGDMVCDKCSAVFLGEEWHRFCGVCVEEVATKIARAQRATDGKGEAMTSTELEKLELATLRARARFGSGPAYQTLDALAQELHRLFREELERENPAADGKGEPT